MGTFIRTSKGRFAGSIGDGKTKAPTAPERPVGAVEQAPEEPSLLDVVQAYQDRLTRPTLEEWLDSRDDFHQWVALSSFEEESEDARRGRYWEGATRYVSTPGGQQALAAILDNPDTPACLRSAAERLEMEMAAHHDSVKAEWSAELAGQRAAQSLDAALRPTAAIDAQARVEEGVVLEPTVSVHGDSVIHAGAFIGGDTSIESSRLLFGTTVVSSVIRDSIAETVFIHDSRVIGAEVRDCRVPSARKSAPTRVTNSELSEGSLVSLAEVRSSTIAGRVVGTNAAGRHTTVSRSRVGQGAEVADAQVTDSILARGSSVQHADVRHAHLSGTARVEGTAEQPSRVENVSLDREFIGPNADVSSSDDVSSVVREGVLYTRYRTQSRSLMGRRVWAYTEARVRPHDGTLTRAYLGAGNAVAKDISSLF